VHAKTIDFARKLQVLQKQGASPGSGASVSTNVDKSNNGNSSNHNSQNQSQNSGKEGNNNSNKRAHVMQVHGKSPQSRLEIRKKNLQKAQNPRKYYRPKA
jgi:hypothetical protein